jgi:hypothetical protein
MPRLMAVTRWERIASRFFAPVSPGTTPGDPQRRLGRAQVPLGRRDVVALPTENPADACPRAEPQPVRAGGNTSTISTGASAAAGPVPGAPGCRPAAAPTTRDRTLSQITQAPPPSHRDHGDLNGYAVTPVRIVPMRNFKDVGRCSFLTR